MCTSLSLAYPRAVFRQTVDGIDLIGQLTAFFLVVCQLEDSKRE